MSLPVPRRENRPESQTWPRTWQPFAGFDDMFERMDRLMAGLTQQFELSAPVDLEETDEAYVIEVDLPGVSREDLTLDWNGRQLALHGEVKERERTGMLRRQTRRTGRFDYSVTLPGEVDADRIEATLTDGVLTVRAPKAESARSRRIKITG